MALQMYVSLQGDNRIARFLMDPATGSLEPNGDVEIDGGPAPLTFNPDNTAIYVGRRDGLLLSSFAMSAEVFGSIAIEITGSGNATGSSKIGDLVADNVSPVTTSFSPTAATISPENTSSTSCRLLACMRRNRPTLCFFPRRTFNNVSPVAAVPE